MALNGNSKRDLTPRQKRAVTALLVSRDVKTAAETASVGYRSLIRWLEIPAFRAAVTSAETDAITNVTRRLLSLSDQAITVLTEAMSNETNPMGVRLRAAQTCLDFLLRLRELQNTEERLVLLEREVFSGKKHR